MGNKHIADLFDKFNHNDIGVSRVNKMWLENIKKRKLYICRRCKIYLKTFEIRVKDMEVKIKDSMVADCVAGKQLLLLDQDLQMKE